MHESSSRIHLRTRAIEVALALEVSGVRKLVSLMLVASPQEPASFHLSPSQETLMADARALES